MSSPPPPLSFFAYDEDLIHSDSQACRQASGLPCRRTVRCGRPARVHIGICVVALHTDACLLDGSPKSFISSSFLHFYSYPDSRASLTVSLSLTGFVVAPEPRLHQLTARRRAAPQRKRTTPRLSLHQVMHASRDSFLVW